MFGLIYELNTSKKEDHQIRWKDPPRVYLSDARQTTVRQSCLAIGSPTPLSARPAFVSRPMSSGIIGFSFRGSLGSSFLARPSGQALHSFANVLEEFDFCTRPYSNASVDRAGTLNPSSK